MVVDVGGSIFLVSADIALGHNCNSLATSVPILDVRTRNERDMPGGRTSILFEFQNTTEERFYLLFSSR